MDLLNLLGLVYKGFAISLREEAKPLFFVQSSLDKLDSFVHNIGSCRLKLVNTFVKQFQFLHRHADLQTPIPLASAFKWTPCSRRHLITSLSP